MNLNVLFDREGFSLIEVLIATTLSLIILAHGFQLLVLQHREYIIQDGIAEAQQNLRIGIDMMSREIRTAGHGAPSGIPKILTMGKEEIRFLANVNAVETHLAGDALPGQTSLSVVSGKSFQAGKRIYLCDAVSCERHTLARNGTGRSLHLSEPLNREKGFEAGSSVNVVNEVRYYLNAEDPANKKLMREVDQGAVSLAEQVAGISFDYLDRDGNATVLPFEVKRIVIGLITTSSKAQSSTASDRKPNRGLNTEVRPRNL